MLERLEIYSESSITLNREGRVGSPRRRDLKVVRESGRYIGRWSRQRDCGGKGPD